ncbi:MAG: hypothetical protein Q9222_005073 [Ikaeria aurantiellina]
MAALASTPAPSSCDGREDEGDKKPVKKRKSWGQELPTPKTNLPPRKRAKTEDEKEQRRIERVLRNRQAAQSSRERKRQEVEKLEGEKSAIELQNDMLKERLMAVEHEKFKLQQQLSQMSAELAALRNGSTRPSLPSPSHTDLLNNQRAIKQEFEDSMFALRTPISLPSDSFSPSSAASSESRSPSPSNFDLGFHNLNPTPDMTQHPAAMFNYGSLVQPTSHKISQYPMQHPIILSSDTLYNGLLAAPPSPPADISFFENEFASTNPSSDDSNLFTFDSMVDLDAGEPDNNGTDNADHEFLNIDNPTAISTDLPTQPAPASPALQPCLGAASSGCDGKGNAS